MKLSRYKHSGNTHRNGIGAMFCVRWLVIASSNAEGQAASTIHSMRSLMDGAGPAAARGVCSAATRVLREVSATVAHTTTNNTYPPDHIHACS